MFIACRAVDLFRQILCIACGHDRYKQGKVSKLILDISPRGNKL